MMAACGTLILDCTNCPDPSRASEPWRQADGLREWVAKVEDGRIVDSAQGRCPDCGALGRVYTY